MTRTCAAGRRGYATPAARCAGVQTLRYARRHHPALRRDAAHLTDGRRRIIERLHDELGKQSTASNAPSPNGSASADPTRTSTSGTRARVGIVLGRIDGGHRLTADELRQPDRQRARTAAHIEHSHPRLDAGEAHERRRQLGPVPAGVTVIGCRDVGDAHVGSSEHTAFVSGGRTPVVAGAVIGRPARFQAWNPPMTSAALRMPRRCNEAAANEEE